MHMLLRTFLVFWGRKKLPPARMTETTSIQMRVLPVDLDLLMHVNNGMYFSYMDFGRWDMIFRNGIYDLSVRKGWYSVVAGETIKFRRSLKLWDKFTIKSKVIGSDERYFFIRQIFLKGSEVMAIGLVKVRFLKRSGGTVSPSEVSQEFDGESVELLPELSQEWFELESKYLVDA